MEMSELLAKLHEAVGTDLLDKIEGGIADDKILDKAIKFLQNNDITYDKSLDDDKIDRLQNSVIEIEGLDPDIMEGFKKVM